MSEQTVSVVVLEWIAHRLGGWEPSLTPQDIPKKVYDDFSAIKDADGKMVYFLDKPKAPKKAPAKKAGPEGAIKKVD